MSPLAQKRSVQQLIGTQAHWNDLWLAKNIPSGSHQRSAFNFIHFFLYPTSFGFYNWCHSFHEKKLTQIMSLAVLFLHTVVRENWCVQPLFHRTSEYFALILQKTFFFFFANYWHVVAFSRNCRPLIQIDTSLDFTSALLIIASQPASPDAANYVRLIYTDKNCSVLVHFDGIFVFFWGEKKPGIVVSLVLLSSQLNNHHCWWKSDVTLKKILTSDIMYWGFMYDMFLLSTYSLLNVSSSVYYVCIGRHKKKKKDFYLE